MELWESKIGFCLFCGNKLTPYLESCEDMKWIGHNNNRELVKVMYSLWDCEPCGMSFEIIERNSRSFTHICPTFWKDTFNMNINATNKKDKCHP